MAPGGIGFVDGRGLGARYDGDLFMGAATPQPGGWLPVPLRTSGQSDGGSEPTTVGCGMRVADNVAKHEITESERLLIGQNFGVVTDIETGPNGNLYVAFALQRHDLRDLPATVMT